MSDNPPNSPAQEGSVSDILAFLAAVIGLPLLGCCGLGLFLYLPGSGQVVARFPMELEPTSAAFTVAEPAVLQVWADIDMRHKGISPNTSGSSLPHVIDYVVELERNGEALEVLRCNPLDSNIFRTSGKHSSMGEANGRSYEGLIKSCTVQLQPGDYGLRAYREEVRSDKRIWFSKLGIVVRVR